MFGCGDGLASAMDYVDLGGLEKAFTRGGNRLCFVDPRNYRCCIKVLRPDRSPEVRRRNKGFPKNLRPLSSFDENIEEYQVWSRIETQIGEKAFELISRCYGFVETNYGAGLVMELIRDSDGRISKTLKQVLWEQGLAPKISEAVSNFSKCWIDLGMPSKKLLLHNMLLKMDGGAYKVLVIDGLGWSSILPVSKYLKPLAIARAKKKINELNHSIEEFLIKKQNGADFGYHGWLQEEQRFGSDS
jgi:hypothetical protein